MRVLHVVTRSHRRGAEVVAVELAAALDALGHQNEVVALLQAADGQTVPDVPPLVASARLHVPTLLWATARLRRHLRRNPADVVVAHGGTAAFAVATGPVRVGVRVWQRILGLDMDGWGRVRRGAWRWMAGRYAGVVALTAALEEEVRRLDFRGPVWVIPNAREPQRFTSVDHGRAAASLRELAGVGPDVALLGFVGHLVEQKQPELAVDVVAAVAKSGRPIHLVVAGDGPRRAAVVQRARELGVGGAVTLLGHRDDPETIFGGVDLAVLTSRAEGLPGVAVEAQMAGCPLVTFPVGGVDEIVVDGVTGVIVARAEVELMASAVIGLLDDRARLAAMGTAAAERAGRFTIGAVAPQYAQLFSEALEQRRAGAR